MASGIIIHVTVGKEKRTEFFSEERIRLGADETSDLQIHTPQAEGGVWLELERDQNVYRIIKFNESIGLLHNGKPIRRYLAVEDGDAIEVGSTGISFSFFTLDTKSALITTNRETHVAQFIEEAALGAAVSPKRDDAKAFLREFVRELSREISWTTKIVILLLAISFIGGILYLGSAVNHELRVSREQSEQQGAIIRKLEERLGQTSQQLGELDKTNKDIIKTVSLAPNLRVEYGNGVCLIVGVYDLVDRKNGKTLRYLDPAAFQPDPYEAMEGEENQPPPPQTAPPQTGLTTEGNGTPIEYDFIGTGFHVGGGYIVTNRHVVQPWEENDLVKQMMTQANGKARIKRLVVYFPNMPQPIPLRMQQLSSKEDLAVGTIDPNSVSPDIPVLPIDTATSDAVAVGRTVVTMGYPSGPDRLLAMVDDDEARAINARFGNSRQALLNYLAQSRKIVPLTTQGAITDLDPRRIVHDAKTAEGGSGAPLFGQSGKVIGVNFGVFTENTAANMAVPIKFAVELLKRAGWKSPEEIQAQQNQPTQTASADTNTSTQPKPQ
ncbi:MAG: serine protease [Acidobacteriota bacterium]|nr:serine protease [Acidobacteriota bacterium]